MTNASNVDRGIKPPVRLDPQVFFWQPVDGARHAICGAQGEQQPGELGQTLCGESVRIRASVAESEWIAFPTCDRCWQAAKSLHGELKSARPRLW